jgi:hypothetical protein
MNTSEALEMALKLRNIHKVIKALYADEFEHHVAAIVPRLTARATQDGCTVLAAAIRISNEVEDDREKLLIMAVGVEAML